MFAITFYKLVLGFRGKTKTLFCISFWRAGVCWPLLCLCRPFYIFERCLDSNQESYRSKQVRYELSHQSPKILRANWICKKVEICTLPDSHVAIVLWVMGTTSTSEWQSTWLFLQVVRIGSLVGIGTSPPPLPQASVPTFGSGGDTLACGRGGGEVPIPTRDIHYSTLGINVLCDWYCR